MRCHIFLTTIKAALVAQNKLINIKKRAKHLTDLAPHNNQINRDLNKASNLLPVYNQFSDCSYTSLGHFYKIDALHILC